MKYTPRVQRDRAGDAGQHGRQRHGHRPGHQRGRHARHGQDAHRIGAGAEEGRVAQRHHAAVAQDQVQAGGGQRVDQHAAHEGNIEVQAERGRDQETPPAGPAGPGSRQSVCASCLTPRRKQARRPEHQHRRHQHIDGDGRQRGPHAGRHGGREHLAQQHGQEGPARRVHHAHQQGADKGAPDRADAADDDTDQHQDQDLLAHAHLHRGDRAEQRSGHGGQHGAQREHAQEQQRHAHAHQRGHLPVGRAGAHQHPARVRVTNQYRPSAAATPKAMIMRR